MGPGLLRRDFCRLAGLAATFAWVDASAVDGAMLSPRGGSTIAMDSSIVPKAAIRLELNWYGSECRPIVSVVGDRQVRLKEVVLLRYSHTLAADTWL